MTVAAAVADGNFAAGVRGVYSFVCGPGQNGAFLPADDGALPGERPGE